MNPPLPARWWPTALLALMATLPLPAALSAGGTAYTKRLETSLLAEPAALAATVGKLPAGRPVKIAEVRGAWLRVSDGAATGWVLSLRIRSGGQQLLNIDEMTDVELLFRHSSISRLQQ